MNMHLVEQKRINCF